MVAGDEADHLCKICQNLVEVRVAAVGPDGISAILETILLKLEEEAQSPSKSWRRIPMISPDLLGGIDKEELLSILMQGDSSSERGSSLFDRTLLTDWGKVLGTLVTQDSISGEPEEPTLELMELED